MGFLRGVIPESLIELANAFGAKRRGESRSNDLSETSHSGGQSGTWDEEGAIGEFIVARALGLPDPELNTFKSEPDVGPFEVQTVTRNWGDAKRTSLLIRPSDLQQGCGNRPYVLVCLSDGNFRVLGWILGNEGPELGPLEKLDGDDVYMVPPKRLHQTEGDFLSGLARYRFNVDFGTNTS